MIERISKKKTWQEASTRRPLPSVSSIKMADLASEWISMFLAEACTRRFTTYFKMSVPFPDDNTPYYVQETKLPLSMTSLPTM